MSHSVLESIDEHERSLAFLKEVREFDPEATIHKGRVFSAELKPDDCDHFDVFDKLLYLGKKMGDSVLYRQDFVYPHVDVLLCQLQRDPAKSNILLEWIREAMR